MTIMALLLLFSVGSYEKGKQDQFIRDKFMIEFYQKELDKKEKNEQHVRTNNTRND